MATGESSEAINSIVVVRSRPNLHPLLIPHPPPTSSTHHILLLVVLVLRLLLLLLPPILLIPPSLIRRGVKPARQCKRIS